MKFVLVLMYAISGTPVYSVTMTEFDSQRACEMAGLEVESQLYKLNPRIQVSRQCLSKMTGQPEPKR